MGEGLLFHYDWCPHKKKGHLDTDRAKTEGEDACPQPGNA